MKSQVSFKFNGRVNEITILDVLKGRLKDFAFKIDKMDSYSYKIYVYSSEKKEKTFKVCKEINNNVNYDDSMTIK